MSCISNHSRCLIQRHTVRTSWYTNSALWERRIYNPDHRRPCFEIGTDVNIVMTQWLFFCDDQSLWTYVSLLFCAGFISDKVFLYFCNFKVEHSDIGLITSLIISEGMLTYFTYNGNCSQTGFSISASSAFCLPCDGRRQGGLHGWNLHGIYHSVKAFVNKKRSEIANLPRA